MELALTLPAIVRGIVNGLIYGSLLGSVAVGLSLIWGVMKVVNLAHGHIVVLGGMLTAFLFMKYGGAYINPITLFVFMIAVGAAMGFVLYWTALHNIIGKADIITLKLEMSSLMTTFGIGLIIYGLHYVINGIYPDYVTEPSLGWSLGKPPYIQIEFLRIEKTRMLVAALGLALALMTHLFMNKTMIGLHIRAAAQDSRALALAGVDPIKVKLAATIVASAVAAASGALYVAYQKSISPLAEHIVAPLSFVIVVLGGLGSILGTYAGGLVLGVIYMLIWNITGEQALSLSVAFALLVVMLVLRPQGLFVKEGG